MKAFLNEDTEGSKVLSGSASDLEHKGTILYWNEIIGSKTNSSEHLTGMEHRRFLKINILVRLTAIS